MDRHPITGWQARLELDFVRRDDATILAGRRHFGPLRVQKALHPEGPGICHAIVLHPPAGICGGDRLSISVAVGDAGHALLTTPGAGKWYRSAGQQARQALDFRVGPGATLEWLPQESIVFDGARGLMASRVSLAQGACFIGWEVLCLGRRASGERFGRGELRLSTRIELAGAPIWAERGKIAGGSALQDSPIGLAGRTVSATLLAAGADIAPAPTLKSSACLACCPALRYHLPAPGVVSSAWPASPTVAEMLSRSPPQMPAGGCSTIAWQTPGPSG